MSPAYLPLISPLSPGDPHHSSPLHSCESRSCACSPLISPSVTPTIFTISALLQPPKCEPRSFQVRLSKKYTNVSSHCTSSPRPVFQALRIQDHCNCAVIVCCRERGGGGFGSGRIFEAGCPFFGESVSGGVEVFELVGGRESLADLGIGAGGSLPPRGSILQVIASFQGGGDH